MLRRRQCGAAIPALSLGIDLSDKPFPGREKFKEKGARTGGIGQLGGWFWESGFDKDPIEDIERIRDLNFRAMYGAWDTLKNVDGLYPNHRIGWAAFIAGKRGSQQLMGDVKLDAADFLEARDSTTARFPAPGASTFIRRTKIMRRGSTATNSSPISPMAKATPTRARTGHRIAAFTAATSRICSWPAAISA